MNDTHQPPQAKVKVTMGSIIGWTLGIITLLAGVATLFSKPLAGIAYLLCSALLIPTAFRAFQEKTKLSISKGVRILFIIILFAVAGSLMGTTAKPNSGQNKQAETAPETAKTYQQVFTFKGSGTKKSEPFTVTGSRFKISYDCKGDLCQAFLYKTDSKIPQVFMNNAGSAKDETVIYGNGEYYIDANTMGSYTMTVYDYR